MPKCAFISIYKSFDTAPNILYTILFIAITVGNEPYFQGLAFAYMFDLVVFRFSFYLEWFSLYFCVFCVSSDHFGFAFSGSILLGLVFSVLSQEIGWEEHLRHDQFCVEWDVKLYSLLSVPSLPALGPWAPPAERGPSLESIYRVSLTGGLCES